MNLFKHFVGVRSALYNWPAKIEHWPADSKGFITGKLRHSTEYGRFSYIYWSFENQPANAQFWPANCKVHSSIKDPFS